MTRRRQSRGRTSGDQNRTSEVIARRSRRARTEVGGRSSRHAAIHRTLGNQQIQDMVDDGAGRTLQASRSDDRSEGAAERHAERVMRPPAKQAGDRDERAGPERSETGPETRALDQATSARIEAATGGGRPLPPATRTFFESRFGRDFSGVRVHTDSRAETAARSVGSTAFTLDKDIVFRSDTYRPGTESGDRLLAHELTHVVQQRAGGDRAVVQRQPDEESETEQNGDGSSDSAETCPLTTYDSTNFVGEQIEADREFVDSLRTIGRYAATENLTVHVTHSFRVAGETPEGAIVEPATHSNHLAGHAIDMNLRTDDGGFYNSDRLHPDRLSEASQSIQNFIQHLRDDSELRWGGDFNTPDEVHIDDHLNADRSAWRERYEATQRAHREDCL